MQKINPPALLEPIGNKHVHVTVISPKRQIAFIAGQVALAKDGSLVGPGDMGKQAEMCFRNVRDAVEALGATPEDIAKMTIYAANYVPEQLALFNDAGDAVFGDRWPVTATTLVGVQALGMDGFLVEIEAVVELPENFSA